MGKQLMATVAALLVSHVVATAQTRRPAQAVDTGRGLYLVYCASCHGPEGRGNGPAADELWRRPTDLTQLAKNNGGVFDDTRIYRAVDGQPVKSHGSLDMPVWGDVFKRRLGLDDDTVRERIEALVRYVRFLQERAGH